MSLLSSCSDREQRTWRIGVSQCSEDIWRNKQNRELQIGRYAHDGVSLEFLSADDSDERQIEQINHFIDERVDLLIVAPNKAATLSEVIDKAYDSGIPVILFDRRTNSDKYTAYMGADNHEVGHTMGHLIAKQMKGKGTLVEITGLKGSSPAMERHNGFLEALKDYPGIRLISSELGDWTEASGQEAMETILRNNTDIDCVFGHNDRLALGARKAAMAHGLSHIVYYGVDALPTPGGGIECVQRGILRATYIYPTQGVELMRLAMNILENKPYQRNNTLHSAVVDSSNADLMMMQYKEQQRVSEDLEAIRSRVDVYFSQMDMQKRVIAFFIVLVAVIVLFIIFIYRSYLTKSRLNAKLQHNNEQLQRLTRELEEMTNARLTFFTNVSHELRTPLTLISSPIEQLLEDKGITGQNCALLQLVNRNVGMLTQLVNEILDFRKIQNGKMQLNPVCFDLAQHLEQWTESFRDMAGRKHLALQLCLETGRQLPVTADREKLARVVSNLLGNALKYTPEGGTVRVILQQSGDRYTISVDDTGQGIPHDDLPHIFDRFYQSKGTTGGTGIGLAIVKAYIELQGGTVKAESKPGEGTRFSITLPMAVAAVTEHMDPAGNCLVADTRPYGREKAQAMLSEEPETEDNSRRKTDKPLILVVDDNADLRAFLRTILHPHYQIMEATDGECGLKEAHKTVPDLVLSDVMMPRMDGLQLCRELKGDPLTCHIPILMLTARTLDEQRMEGYEYGADAYLTKPFTAPLLLARIRSLLNNRAMLRHCYTTGQALTTATPGTDPRDRQFVNRLRAFIEKHMADSDLSVDSIGAEMALGRVQLYRKTKALTGHSPVEIVRQIRLQRGHQLLLTTDKTISEIAYETGFSAPAYFAKCFRDEYGKSPAETRADAKGREKA